ncbi:TPA: hypothetical protein N0F65_003486 [Lagenidium giganteum]|uniref:PDZ domain-containing protein n=1 Tax=Lagenidium giganteum TaxID=4803 RepID=A0AAV2YI75_9STRA|nr:TPA: hypothetical protein N0F65_003486 [Lagenidium giganteum]
MDEEGVYQVQLHKDVYGLGIYFTESERGAVVDPKLPFYRLPDGSKAPGEASGVIAPADVLLAIGDRDLRRMSFAAAVEELRRIPTGAILLTFRRGHHENAGENKPQDANSTDPAHDEQMAVALEEDDKKRRLWRLFQRSLRGTLPSFMDDREFAIDALLLDMEQTLDREQKCRFLAEKKNILYRTELLRMGEENATLRFQLAQKQRQLRQMEELERSMHLAI